MAFKEFYFVAYPQILRGEAVVTRYQKTLFTIRADFDDIEMAAAERIITDFWARETKSSPASVRLLCFLRIESAALGVESYFREEIITLPRLVLTK